MSSEKQLSSDEPETQPSDAPATELGVRLCSRCQTKPARPGQWYCRGCGNRAMRYYRARGKRELDTVKQAWKHLTGKNTFTRERFEQSFGRRRRILVLSGDGVATTSGLVIGFMPGEELVIRDESGKEILVKLEQVIADEGFRYEPLAQTAASEPDIQSASAEEGSCGPADGTPYPLLPSKGQEDWYFQSPKGQEEIRQLRLWCNELSAIGLCHALVRAQRSHALTGHGCKGASHFARKVHSSAGKRDGLNWKAEGSEKQSIIGRAVADAYWEGSGAKAKRSGRGRSPKPFHGYLFKLLTQQGKKASGGKLNYVRKGRLVGGFAYVVYPAFWGYSGQKTFMVNNQGTIFVKDLGPETARLVQQFKTYDPDETWSRSE